MSDIGKFCCFNCPAPDQTLKRLDDACPTCGYEYGFPLTSAPAVIGEFEVERPLGRGFYGATYVARRKGPLRTQRVLKVSPKATYKTLGKSFDDEVARHAAIAEGADHVIAIEQVFDADISFDGVIIPCHVAELEYVEGEPLSRHLTGRAPLGAAEASQIACDLFRIREEFERALYNHNDLHENNIIVRRLRPDRRRPDAIEPGVRAMAIDLGSVTPDRRSGGDYLGDWHWIGRHIEAMAERLLAAGDDAGDLENRMALKLHSIAQSLAPATENQRPPSAADFIQTIRDEYYRTAEPWRPWRDRRMLRTFEHSYNAQTLDAWYVPQLLVDPEGTWLPRVSSPGPLVMTGMRGCGKTMLLHSLQFHARATVLPNEKDADALRRVREDGYVGLFVPAQCLIPAAKLDRAPVERLFARLFVAYAGAAARALAHLEDLDPEAPSIDACSGIAEAVRDALAPAPDIPEPVNVEQLERHLTALLNRLNRSDSVTKLAASPSTAFPRLAEAVRAAAQVWQGAQILFLLDDVSTRYLDEARIEELLSALIFQHPVCAFKMTSEAQTIFLALKSPGQVNPAASGRDFATFDLGAEVYDRLKRRDGREFVNAILSARAKLFPGHPQAAPLQVLGDINLTAIARSIASTSSKSGERKKLYRGMSALAGVCVGDIGSVIQIYQRILASGTETLPVPDHRQNDTFQDFCARYLYQLDLRDSGLKAIATGFAEASHQLLMESGRETSTGRLRQYTAIYVRVTSGDVAAQMGRLRELVDAGVFVFTGGAPRTKTHDSNPTQQFKLTFRKIFGLVNFIGLSERDRFELSGPVLEEWLANPGSSKDVLLRNLSKGDVEEPNDEDDETGEGLPLRPLERVAQPIQLDLPHTQGPAEEAGAAEGVEMPPATLPLVAKRSLAEIAMEPIDTLVVGLGFEERTLASMQRLLAAVRPRRILGIRYKLAGESGEMKGLAVEHGVALDEIPYGEVEDGSLPNIPVNSMIDVTGLAKAALFRFVREGLRHTGQINVAYTGAARYFPLETDLAAVLHAHSTDNRHLLLAALKDVLTGEKSPYHLVSLLSTPSDGTRLRALAAFASAKHERILHLMQARDYEAVEIVTDASDTSRAKVGEIAAAVALEGRLGGACVASDAGDLDAIMQILGRRHHDWYVRGGLSFEIGLTGNKIQAVAAAALTAALPVNEVWYVAPAEFDASRFTHGVGQSSYYTITLPPTSGQAG